MLAAAFPALARIGGASVNNQVAPSLTPIGVGFDTARYGHHVTFLREDLQPATTPCEFTESCDGYRLLEQKFQQLAQRIPNVLFRIRIDAAGQYASNLDTFLRQLPYPKTISVGEPVRNQKYRQAIFPKCKSDPTESHCAGRFALREDPKATLEVPTDLIPLREIASRLEAQTRQSTRLANQLHNLMARVFPELATIASDFQSRWVLCLLNQYPTPVQLARARDTSLTAIPFLTTDKAQKLQSAARTSVGSFRGAVAEKLVRMLVGQLRRCSQEEDHLRKLLVKAYQALPQSNQIDTIPGIGSGTAAVLTAKMVSIDRFETPDSLVGYFGIFPEKDASGLDKDGKPKPGRHTRMCKKGSDLVRKYLWNAAKVACRHNPAVRALYRRLRARGLRGDVALGHCMRKLLHLVWVVWKSGKAFDPNHYPWEQVSAPTVSTDAAGHNQGTSPERKVVTAADSTVSSQAPAVNEPSPSASVNSLNSTAKDSGWVDFAFLRENVTMQQVLTHLNWLTCMRGSGPQRRGPCPIHGTPTDRTRTFSVHLQKSAFQCFHPPCASHGNVLDLWAAVHRLPLLEAAHHLAATFNLGIARGTEKRNP
jgi:transposase